MVEAGGREQVAEVNRQARKPLFPARASRKGQALSAADVGGNDLGAGLENQEARAVEQLHQRAGAGEAAFREQHEPPAALEVLGHAFDSEGRVHVHGERAAVDHDAPVKPAQLRRGAGGDEAPVVREADADEQPIPPRNVVGQQQDRAGRVEHCHVVRAEAIEDSE